MRHAYPLDFAFDLPPDELLALVGGKAANLAVMLGPELRLPVPPGFVVTTEACRAYLAGGWPDGLDEELREQMAGVEAATGRRFGDPANPLLVSVRSGAPVSMPGMMDTILDLGLNDATTAGLAAATGDAAFAAACRDRLGVMFRDIVGVDAVPEDPWTQLRLAVEAVFRSWNSERAIAYRRREGIADDLGTAVTVQAMVFGNLGADSGTGVAFTRNPATGEPVLYGDVLFDAQGEDVVAGTHRTEPIGVLHERLPEVAAALASTAARLEHHLRDLCDIEFTIERGRLWMLQVRVGKRSPQAALRMAVDMAEDPSFPLTRREAVERVAHLLSDPPTRTTGRSGYVLPLVTGPRGLARRRERRDRDRRRGGGGRRRGRPRRDPRARRDLPRRRPRDGARRRDPHRPGRARQPRGGRRARLGDPGRRRRGGVGRRGRRRRHRRAAAPRRRRDHDRRRVGRGLRGRDPRARRGRAPGGDPPRLGPRPRRADRGGRRGARPG